MSHTNLTNQNTSARVRAWVRCVSHLVLAGVPQIASPHEGWARGHEHRPVREVHPEKSLANVSLSFPPVDLFQCVQQGTDGSLEQPRKWAHRIQHKKPIWYSLAKMAILDKQIFLHRICANLTTPLRNAPVCHRESSLFVLAGKSAGGVVEERVVLGAHHGRHPDAGRHGAQEHGARVAPRGAQQRRERLLRHMRHALFTLGESRVPSGVGPEGDALLRTFGAQRRSQFFAPNLNACNEVEFSASWLTLQAMSMSM